MTGASSRNRPAHPLVPRPPLIGRERELALLRGGLEIGLAGHGRILLVSGEPGIGKTRTAEELAGDAANLGALVFWGRCYEAEWTPPFWPWVQVFRSLVHNRSTDALRTELGNGAADIAQLVPEIAELLPDMPVLPVLAPEQARFRLFDHIAAFLRRAAARQPLVLILDDLHWADALSLLLLEFVAHEARDAPLVIVGTYRDNEVGRQHPLARTVSEVVRVSHSQRITLQGLSEIDVGRLVEADGVPLTSELTSAIFNVTEGNPFFVHEVAWLLARHEADASGGRDERDVPIPQSVRAAIGRRLDRQSSVCNQVLATASAIGREFSLAVLARVSDRETEEILGALAEAAGVRLIEDVPRRVGGYRFGHALIRDTLYEELSSVQKVRLHRHIGLTLETLFESDLGPHLAELAHHFAQAAPGGDVDRAVDYGRRAGERAMGLLAFEHAAEHFERTLQVLDLRDPPDQAMRCELTLALAAAQLNAGDVETGRGTYMRAANLARNASLPELLARAALGFSGEPIAAWGFDAELKRLLEDALEMLGREDSPLRAQLLTRLATEYNDVDTERMATLVQEAEGMARRLGDERTLAFALIGRTHAHLDRYVGWEPLIATGHEMSELGVAIGNHGLMCSALISRLCGHLLAGDMVAADVDIEAYARIAQESRHPFFLFWAPTFRALRALTNGSYLDAERYIAAAVALVPRAHLAHWGQWYAPNLFTLRREQSQIASAEQPLREVIADTLNPGVSLTYRAMLTLVLVETGRNDDASREFEDLIRDDFAFALRRSHWDTNIVHGLSYVAEVCASLADVAPATTVYDLLVPYASQNLVYGGTWHAAGSASHYLGLLAATLDRWDDATQHFDDALAANRRMGARPFVARTQLAYATMLARRGADGDRARIHEMVAAAMVTANELGMVRLSAELATLRTTFAWDRAGSGKAISPSFGLTEREFDVLRLLVAGRSNPEIAAMLYISTATARTHVSNIFAKLDVHSRTEAVDYAHRNNLLAPTDRAST